MNIDLPLDGKQRHKLRPVSKVLLHSEYALEAYLLITQEPRFYAGQLAEVTGCQPSYAGPFVRRLEDAGLVERLPREAGQRRVYLQKLPSPVWEMLHQLAIGLLDEPVADIARLPSGRR
jgi:DNA-binding MarR family transcriptional regulator